MKILEIIYNLRPGGAERLSDCAYKVFDKKYSYNTMINNYETIFNE